MYIPHQRSCTSDSASRSFSPTAHIRSAKTAAASPGAQSFPASLAASEIATDKASTETVRRNILKIVTGNAAISWAVAFIGYWDVRDVDESKTVRDWERDLVRWLVCVLSFAQVALVILYNNNLLAYSESLRTSFKLSQYPIPRLLQSPQALFVCTIECAFHLLILPPRLSIQGDFSLFGTPSLLSLNDFLYTCILLRNYHTFQLLFWISPISTKTAYFFAELAHVNFGMRWVWKSLLSTYSLKLILGVYGAVVLVSGLILYIVEKGVFHSELDTPANSMWLISVTQAIIGYGDITPYTFFGQITLLFNCFIGSFCLSLIIANLNSMVNLNLVECSMYSELAYTRFKRRYEKQAVLLLQKWWRFMIMRHRGPRNGHVIVGFYTQLRHYGWIISKGQRVKDRRFERQINAFEVSLSQQFRSMTTYFQPIPSAEILVIPIQTVDLLRTQYRIKQQIKRIYQFARKHRPRHKTFIHDDFASISNVSIASPSPEPALFRMSPRVISPSSTSGGRNLARAKLKAYQKLRGRLVRGEDPGSPSICATPSSML